MDTIISTIMDNLVLPAIVGIATAIILIGKRLLERIVKSIEIKNELITLEKRVAIRGELVDILNDNVKAAVAANMSLRNELKENGEKLTEEQAEKLRKSAYNFVMNTLPPSLKEDDGILLEIIGGKDTLDALIRALNDKYVYEYKTHQIIE